MQELGTELSHIDAVGSLSDPPIVAATLVSGLLLVIITLAWLSWSFHPFRTRSTTRKVLLIVLGCGIFLFAGIFQIWLGHMFYRRYAHLDASVTLGLSVPVAPVWLTGFIAGIVFFFAHALRRARTQQN